MNELEKKIKAIELDEVSAELDGRMEALFAGGAGEVRGGGEERYRRRFMLYVGLANAAVLCLVAGLLYVNWPEGKGVGGGSVGVEKQVFPGVVMNGVELRVREQFLINERTLLICWSGKVAGKDLKGLREVAVSHSGDVKFTCVPLRTDYDGEGRAWEWALFVTQGRDVDIRYDPPFIEEKGSGIAMMLTPVDLTEIVDGDSLLDAQRRVAMAKGAGGVVFSLDELQTIAGRH